MSGPSSAQIPDASNSFRIHCFKSYSVNGFFSRTHFAACPNAPPMMRSIITPAEKWDSFCSRLQHASYFCTRSAELTTLAPAQEDRKSTRLNSSHVAISYAVFCLKKKTIQSKEENNTETII